MNKKIGIVTFVRTGNYGAALQCYALNRAVAAVGGEPVTMDYWPEYFRVRYYIDKVPFYIVTFYYISIDTNK